jgi:hypothetical protein
MLNMYCFSSLLISCAKLCLQPLYIVFYMDGRATSICNLPSVTSRVRVGHAVLRICFQTKGSTHHCRGRTSLLSQPLLQSCCVHVRHGTDHWFRIKAWDNWLFGLWTDFMCKLCVPFSIVIWFHVQTLFGYYIWFVTATLRLLLS